MIKSRVTHAWRWGFIAGLLAGVVQAHAVQPIAAWTGALPWQGKHWISLAGTAIYTAALVLLLLRRRAGLWVVFGGPIVGATAVAVGALLVRVGVIQGPFQSDAFQLVGGVLQLTAVVVGISLARDLAPPRWACRRCGRVRRDRRDACCGSLPDDLRKHGGTVDWCGALYTGTEDAYACIRATHISSAVGTMQAHAAHVAGFGHGFEWRDEVQRTNTTPAQRRT